MTRYSLNFGAFEIDSLPSQCQVAVCHGFYVVARLRGRGYGKELKSYQMHMLRLLQYDYAQCTVVANNTAQIKILKWAGWTKRDEFYSERQGTVIEIWGTAIIGREKHDDVSRNELHQDACDQPAASA